MIAAKTVTKMWTVPDMLIIPGVQCQVLPSIPDYVCCGLYPALCRTWLPRECHTPGTHSRQCPSSSARATQRNNFVRAPRLSVGHVSYLLKSLSHTQTDINNYFQQSFNWKTFQELLQVRSGFQKVNSWKL